MTQFKAGTIGVSIRDVGHDEAGFYEGRVTFVSADGAIVSGKGYGRGAERSVAFALWDLADAMLMAFPERREAG